MMGRRYLAESVTLGLFRLHTFHAVRMRALVSIGARSHRFSSLARRSIMVSLGANKVGKLPMQAVLLHTHPVFFFINHWLCVIKTLLLRPASKGEIGAAINEMGSVASS